MEKYSKHLLDPSINMKTIYRYDQIVGSVAKFILDAEAEITYWIDRSFWGKGIATVALQHFLKTEKTRPIFARTAFDNLGSQRVLEKSGILKIGRDKGYANARKTEIEEYIFRLSD